MSAHAATPYSAYVSSSRSPVRVRYDIARVPSPSPTAKTRCSAAARWSRSRVSSATA
ncbi:hypothetical protein [Halosegnis marinus]|uniref:hypothetical protein n=1 Tax=Halosegnis marinus TaxID=3034023 RepID=UPI00361F4B1C